MIKLFKTDKNGVWNFEPWVDMKDISIGMNDIFYDLLVKGYTRDQIQYIIMEAFKTVDTFDAITQQDRETTARAIKNMIHGDEGKMDIVDGKF